jgi:hypothetical protein
MSFPLVGNPSSERLRTSRSDKSRYHTYILLSSSIDALIPRQRWGQRPEKSSVAIP